MGCRRLAASEAGEISGLDGDVILAAQVILSTGLGDIVTVAADNVGHRARFVDAQPWEKIAP
jgi:hypothetical protein